MHEGNKTMVDWGSRTRVRSIKVDYQTELQHLVLSVFIQVRGVVIVLPQLQLTPLCE